MAEPNRRGSYNTVYRKHAAGKWATSTTAVNPKALSKREDRAGLKGHALKAKKGGGGGVFTWGVPGDEINAPSVLSRGDPNYDSEEEDEGVVFESSQQSFEEIARRAGVPVKNVPSSPIAKSTFLNSPPRNNYNPYKPREAPKTPLPLFKSAVIRMVDALFNSEDGEEFMSDLVELESHMLHFEMVRRLVTMSMERNDRERELTSQVLCTLCARDLLSVEQCGKGFERIFELIDDIILDIPHAKKFVAQFLARAIADEVLPPSFLADPLVESLGGEMVEQAKVLLSIKHGVVRLERVWGPSEGSSVEVLKGEIKMILLEYLSSSDLDEVCACIKKLNVPHFHHEVVKRAVVIAMDKHQRERAMMATLLSELNTREILSVKQMQLGFSRLHEAVDDLELDTPGAAEILKIFFTQAVSDGCLEQSFVDGLVTKAPAATK